MKNQPEKIYLQIGEDVDSDTDFNALWNVTFQTERIFNNDLMYVKSDRSKFVYLVIGVTNNQVYGCFQKEKSAERYAGNNERYFIKKIEVA